MPRLAATQPGLRADLTGLPPLPIQAGTHEILLDAAIRLATEELCSPFGYGALGPEALATRQQCADTRVMTSVTGGGIAVLDTQTCWELLAGEEVGRLAVSVHRHPDIFPVNYAVDAQTIVFRTAEGTKLFALFVDSAVAFEVDSYNAKSGTAWSVVIKGHAAEIPMQDRLDDLAFPLFSWIATPKPRFMRVVPDEITGRRFHVVQRPSDAAG